MPPKKRGLRQKRSARAVKQADKDQQEFLKFVAHELRQTEVKQESALSKKMVLRLAAHVPEAEDVTRIDPNTEAIWTAVYRISLGKPTTWGNVAKRLRSIENDDSLIKAIGARRGMQIICKYDSDEMGDEQHVSLSSATRVEVSLGQAYGQARSKAGNYHSSFVTDIYFYIR